MVPFLMPPVILTPPAIVEEVRRRRRHPTIRYRIRKQNIAPPVIVDAKPKHQELCTTASPEFCGPEAPIVMMERLHVNPNTMRERWEAIVPWEN